MILFKNPLKQKKHEFKNPSGFFTAMEKVCYFQNCRFTNGFFLCSYFTNSLQIKQHCLSEKKEFLKKVFVQQKRQGKTLAFSSLGVDITKKTSKRREKGRRDCILPKHIGRVFLVHNGKTLCSIHVYRKMLGHKFGEFASTRKKPLHKKKK